MSKGSDRRPGTGYEKIEQICPPQSRYCSGCGYLPVWCKCQPVKDSKDKEQGK